MSNLDRLAMSVTHSDGRVTRWGPDEADPTDIPGDLTFSTAIPGGFKSLSCSLLRRIDIDYADQALFDQVRVYAPGNRTVWEGQMQQFPRSHGDSFSINPGAVGNSVELTFDPTFQEIYVDRNPGSFGEIPLERQQALANTGVTAGDFSWGTQHGTEDVQLVCAIPNQSLGAQTLAETWARYAPLNVGSFAYRGSATNFPAGWVTNGLGVSDDFSGTEVYTLTFDNGLRVITLTTPRPSLALNIYSNGHALTPASGSLALIDKIAVYGTHGVGQIAISGEPNGFYASDIIANILARAAPGLVAGEITATTFVIPHLVFLDPTTGEDAITFVNAYHGYPWGVYENREFFWRPWDPDRLTWQARLSTGARLDLEGETADQIFNGVYVTYTDPTGRRRSIGPPGTVASATDSSLQDTSVTNPLNQWGKTKIGRLDVSQTTTQAGALQLGQIWLAEHAAPQFRGTATLTGTVTHPTEGDVPVWRVRAGDHLSIVDHPASVPRRIIETNYTHSNRQLTASLDNTPHALDAILARFGAQLVGVL